MKWPLDVPEPVSVVLFTNRNCMIFDAQGEQITELQNAIDCYGLDASHAVLVADHAKRFELAKWREWKHEITKEEFLYLLGLGIVVKERTMRSKEA